MADFTFPELNSNQGTDTADALRNRANAAANLLCSAYQNYPGALLPGTIDPLGVGAFTDGLLGGLCAPRGMLPPPPSAPFEGGQCEALYRLVTTRSNSDGVSTFDVGTGFGKLTGYRVVKVQFPNGEADAAFVDQGVGTTSERLAINLANGQPDVDGGKATFNFTPQRVDGGEDNCGSPSPVYPPVTPPPGAYDTNVPVGQPGNTVNVPVSIIPVIFPPGAIQFRPEFNVDVGGVNVNFDLGGVTFSIGKPAESQPKLPGTDPRQPSIPPTQPRSPLAKCEPYNDAALQCKVETLQEGLLNGGYDIVNGSTATAQSGKYVDQDGEFYKVTVVVTERPINLKIQPSTAPADDVWFVGWFAWLENDRPLLRQPLHFEAQSWFAPENVTGFVYQLNFGCKGAAVWQRRVRKAFVDVC